MAHEPLAGANVAPALPTHKTCTKCGASKPLSEYTKHRAGKFGRRPTCKPCSQEERRARYRSAPEKEMARTKAYSDQRADWYRLYRSLHSHIAVDRVTTWRKENPEKHAANHAKRRAAKRNACPPWVDHAAIEAIYAEAARLTAETGIPHQVDHIIPLMGKNVCGLHVPWNLRAIPAIENQRKGNKLEDNPPR